MNTTVAKVTHTKGARLHLDNAGHATCGSGRGRTIATTARPLADADHTQLCRRCLPALRAAADIQIADHAGGGRSQYRTRGTAALQRVREHIRTPQEIARAEAFAAEAVEVRRDARLLRPRQRRPPHRTARPHRLTSHHNTGCGIREPDVCFGYTRDRGPK
jgi:hypothetical protein